MRIWEETKATEGHPGEASVPLSDITRGSASEMCDILWKHEHETEH